MGAYPRMIAVAAVLLVASAVAVRAQATDPAVGTWKLDAAKSTYEPGPAPKSVLNIVEPAGGKGYKVSVDAVRADGTPAKWSFTSEADGTDVPVRNNPEFETAALTRLSPTTATTVYKKAGKTVATVKSTVSADGKTLTSITTGTAPGGQAIHNVAVYTKQ